MKSLFALPASAAAAISMLALLTACGQPGPLYMPKPPARPGAAPAQAAPATAPAPVTTVSPPAPAAGTTLPSSGSNANNTQAPQQTTPATQQ